MTKTIGAVEPTGHRTPWTHVEMRAAAAARARHDGGLMVCSGGTTGAPKLTVIAPDLGVTRVSARWRPLRAGDVLLNLFSVGKMWGAQYFYNAFALHSRATVAPMGALTEAEVAAWADEIAGMGVTAIAGAPNVLAQFADGVRAAGLDLPVRSVLWSGEPMTPARQAAIAAAFPNAGLWGNYGSIENFVIGVSRPECGFGVQHLLPEQVIELDDGGALLTRAGVGWPSPAERLRLGDRIRPATCPCGADDAFEVDGRADGNFKLYGAMIETGPVLRYASRLPGVDDAQFVVHRDPEVRSAVAGLRIHYTGANTDEAAVRRQIMHSFDDLEVLDRHTPEAVVVEHVGELVRNPSTGKVLPILHDSAAPAVPA